MARQHEGSPTKLIEFLKAQNCDSLSTATNIAKIDGSSKGFDSQRLKSPECMLWANIIGSSNAMTVRSQEC